LAPTELDSLLAALVEPDNAADMCPPGFKYQKLQHCAIGLPIAEMKEVRQGNRIVSVPTPESRKRARAAETIRFECLDRTSPLAVEIFESHARAVSEYQRSLVPAKSAAPAEPANDSLSSRPIRIIRR
jgi:hypothetical protein